MVLRRYWNKMLGKKMVLNKVLGEVRYTSSMHCGGAEIGGTSLELMISIPHYLSGQNAQENMLKKSLPHNFVGKLSFNNILA